jgi:UDP-N-acetyl-D-glucosamine dehydrogenase
MKSVPLDAESIKGYDCLLIATNHSAYDWQTVSDHAALIVDTRGAMRNVGGRREHIVNA